MTYLALGEGGAPGPLFLFQNGQPLSRALLSSWLQQIMASANHGLSWNWREFLQWQLPHRGSYCCGSSGNPRPLNPRVGSLVKQCLSALHLDSFWGLGVAVTEAGLNCVWSLSRRFTALTRGFCSTTCAVWLCGSIRLFRWVSVFAWAREKLLFLGRSMVFLLCTSWIVAGFIHA